MSCVLSNERYRSGKVQFLDQELVLAQLTQPNYFGPINTEKISIIARTKKFLSDHYAFKTVPLDIPVFFSFNC